MSVFKNPKSSMTSPIGKQLRWEEDGATSPEVIAAIEDLLTQILVRLPVKSLLRFKSVSKPWLALISSPHFCVLKSKRCSKHILGLLLRQRWMLNPKFDFIPLNPGQVAPFERVDFVKDEMGGLYVIQYCNGLLLCCSEHCGPQNQDKVKYYVFNPTTRHYTTVPLNRILDSDKVSSPYTVNLAFDPRISPHFKLLCCYMIETRDVYHYEIGFYSSETGLMSQIHDHLHTNVDLLDARGLYWNGAINWMACRKEQESLFFNFDEERVRPLPMPPVPDATEGVELDFMDEHGRRVRYFGESNDHLYLIQTNINLTPQFNVYELDRDYSGWFARFRVDPQQVCRSFPEAVNSNLHPLDSSYYCFGILGIVEKDGDEKSFLVLSVPGKAIRFNLKDGSFTKMCDFPATNYLPLYYARDSFQHAESLHPL